MAAISAYIDRLPALKAELSSMMAESSMLPWMRNNERRQVVRRWQNASAGYMPRRRASIGELMMAGIKVDYASKSG
jgi:hypothetical protein